ncbi:uncharacterized protein LOC123674181 isoform X1 [Harmonia axyridis]|uniref:uncharacterized protein LOC123674181 isoform X1 n=1 Tax=Harmonia axyridis TaxID=115357 RepID=UPI001E279CD5|nr:uncharacterized protein LOC123674181 isoform X1 [Harmonia axyridis]
MHFTVNIALWAVFMICRSTAEEASWSWADDKNQGAMNINEQFDQDLHPEGSENKESIVNLNDTQIGQIIDEILDSGRQGRSLDGFDEVYADPNVQNALQKGDDGEARNIIKDRLCYLGLMQCEEDIEGKRPFIAPEDLQYAQPVAINPIGRPIPTIPIRGPKRGTYGPPRPVHVPQNGGKYPPPNFAPPNRFGPNLNTNPNKPPRRGYGAPSKPFYGNKPPSPVYNGDYSPVEDIPYAFEIGSQSSHSESHFQSSLQKDKIFPGDKAGSKSDSFGAPVQHVHHHYHHDSENSDKTPTVIVKPVPVPVPVSSSSNSYESFNTNSGTHLAFKPSVQIGGSGLNSGLYGSQSSGGLTIGGSGLNSGSYGGQSSGGLTIGGSGFSSGSYGGQTLASYGGASGNNGIVKPVSENFGGQNYGSNQYGSSNYGSSFGQYSTNDFYKKELNLNGNSLTTNYLQGAHSDNYNSQFGNSDDCVCVPINQCQNHDVIGRKDDLYLAIDPRNIKSDIQAEEERVITDANGTMTVVTVPVGSNLNITELSADKKNTEEVKKISKREAPIYNSTVSKTSAKAEARQYGQNIMNDFMNKKIKPTFGVSFGLPHQGAGGYPISPYGPNPLVNPYGGVVGGGGINLGLVSVNPLISVQVTKDDYGHKEIKPFINLHVTPNDYLVHKFEDLIHYKKGYVYNKHKHVHYHKPLYKPYGYVHQPHPEIYRPYPPHFETGPVYEGPHHLHESPEFGRPPIVDEYPGPFVNGGHNPESYYDDPSNYGGGYSGYDDFYGRTAINISSLKIVNGNAIHDQYFKNYYDGQKNYGENNGQLQYFSNGYEAEQNPDRLLSLSDTSRRGKSLQPKNTVKFPINRRRRDTTQKTEHTIEKRQGYFGGQQVCGPRHVCCRKPRQQNHINSFGSSQCGVRHSTGINGRIKTPAYVDGDSEFGEYPWQVAILKKDPKESVYVCGGTLIDALHIITAAHCVKTYTNYDLRVRLGEWDVNHDVEFYPYIERDIAAVTVHPEFYAGTLYNDLAILRMDKPVDYNKYPHISPACLPNPRDDYTGTRCWTTGWGKDAFGDFGKYQNILKEVDVPIVGQSQCHRQLQQTRLGYEFKLHPGFICAGGEEGKDACKGDGGGPLVCERSGTMQLVGVVSWGIGCGQYGVPGVYVRVGHYLDWIRQVTQIY